MKSFLAATTQASLILGFGIIAIEFLRNIPIVKKEITIMGPFRLLSFDYYNNLNNSGGQILQYTATLINLLAFLIPIWSLLHLVFFVR